jgi:hypothetical protein
MDLFGRRDNPWSFLVGGEDITTLGLHETGLEWSV